MTRIGMAAVLLLSLTLNAPMGAQGRGERGRGVQQIEPNPRYDGRFTFARIRYSMGMDFGFGSRGGPPWSHDYPRGERNFTKIVQELTAVRTRVAESVVIELTDPDLFKYPVAYMAEPGFWRMQEPEVAALNAYLKKGGFIIFDDFRGPRDWANLEFQMQLALPDLRFIPIDGTHPIFDAFYRIPQPEALETYGGYQPSFWAIFEDNDPKKRMIALANRDNDLSEYWEFSGEGYFPVDLTNEAYKLGINYIVYALSR